MNDTQARLSNCFSAVFPDLPADQIFTASVDTVPAWDSVAMVTLLSVIEEEFGRPIETDAIADLVSFSALLAHVERPT